MRGRLASDLFGKACLSISLPLVFAAARSSACFSALALALLRKHMVMKTIAVAAIPTPKTIVTIMPDVVRVSSFFMQTSALAVLVKQRFPGAHEAISVVVATQLDVPEVVAQTEVDFVEVTEQSRVPRNMLAWNFGFHRLGAYQLWSQMSCCSFQCL